MGDYLKTGSPAEAWFLRTTTPKKVWPSFKTAFKKEFPDVDRAEKTAQDLERELLAMKLHPDSLGKTERYANDNVWTHVAFAQRALDLARRAGIAGGTSNIWQVRDALPNVVREKVPEKQMNWITFCDTIKQVDVGHIKEGAQKHTAEQEEKARLRAEFEALRNAVLATKTPDTPSAVNLAEPPYLKPPLQQHHQTTTHSPEQEEVEEIYFGDSRLGHETAHARQTQLQTQKTILLSSETPSTSFQWQRQFRNGWSSFVSGVPNTVI